jgi:hypothetical protein
VPNGNGKWNVKGAMNCIVLNRGNDLRELKLKRWRPKYTAGKNKHLSQLRSGLLESLKIKGKVSPVLN